MLFIVFETQFKGSFVRRAGTPTGIVEFDEIM
jgi:hypothetical protein